VPYGGQIITTQTQQTGRIDKKPSLLLETVSHK
jgi:hypothetical protein